MVIFHCYVSSPEGIFGGEKNGRLVDSFGFGALVHGEACCETVGGFLKKENKNKSIFANSSPQTSRHTHTTYLLRNFAANFAGKTSPAKIRQQNLANYFYLTNKYVALKGTYTNMHVHRYELGHN